MSRGSRGVRKAHEAQLLREFVSVMMLREDDTSAVLGDLRSAGGGLAGGGGGGGGQGMGAGHALDGIFIAPFVNAFKIVSSETKKSAVATVATGRAVFEALASTVIPWASAEFSEILKQRDEAVRGLEQKYQRYYDAVWDSYKLNDVTALAFLCSPPAAISFLLAKGSPSHAIDAAYILTGGNPNVARYLKQVCDHFSISAGTVVSGDRSFKEKGPKASASHGTFAGTDAQWSGSVGGGGSSGTHEGHRAHGNALMEDSAHDATGDSRGGLKVALLNPKLMSMVSSASRGMQSDAASVLKSSLDRIVDLSRTVMQAGGDINAIKTKLAPKMKPDDRRKLELAISEMEKQGNDTLGSLGPEIGSRLRTAFVNGLKNELKSVTVTGAVGDDSSFSKMYERAISAVMSDSA